MIETRNINLERLPPNSLEIEQGVLGCIILDATAALPVCVEKLGETAQAFYDQRHQVIYKFMVQLWKEMQPITQLTLFEQLKRAEQLEDAGGLNYLSQLAEASPSGSGVEYFLEQLVDYWSRRQMIKVGTEAVQSAYDLTLRTDELLGKFETDVLRISKDAAAESSHSIQTLVLQALDRMEHYLERRGEPDGISTGFKDLDRMTGGLHKGDMIVIAARPSVGKTSFAMNIVEHAALDLKVPVGVFSLEMTSESLVLRTLCSRARMNMRHVRDGLLSPNDFPKLSFVAGKIQSAPLHIDDTSGLSILQLKAKARRMHQQHGIELMVVDYLQLLHTTNRRAETRQQEIADISNGVKQIAKELNIPVIVLSQLNRDLEKDRNRKPRLSDLRESGSIEQDADVVGMLYKPVNNEDEDKPMTVSDVEPVNLLIAKQRNGPIGDVQLTFFKSHTRFENAAKEMPDFRVPYND